MRRRTLVLGTAGVACGGLAGCAAPAGGGGAGGAASGSGNRVALVIGNAAYDNAPALASPAHDAADMCAALARLRFRTLCHTNLRDRAEFDARVREYAALLGPSTVGLVYYSGHGVQVGSANFLIPTRAQPRSAAEDPTRVLYGLEDLFAVLRPLRTALQVVILDACRTDLFGSAPRSTARGPAPAGAARTPLLKSLDTVARAGSGLAPILDAPSGTKVLYATASRDTAYDSDGASRNGPLTRHILRHITRRGLTLDEFMREVTAGVEAETTQAYGRRQSPFTYGNFAGSFCFAGCPGEDGPMPSF